MVVLLLVPPLNGKKVAGKQKGKKGVPSKQYTHMRLAVNKHGHKGPFPISMPISSCGTYLGRPSKVRGRGGLKAKGHRLILTRKMQGVMSVLKENQQAIGGLFWKNRWVSLVNGTKTHLNQWNPSTFRQPPSQFLGEG